MPDAATLLTPASANNAPTAQAPATTAVSTQVVQREGVDDPKRRLLFVGILLASVFAIYKFKKLWK